MSGKRLNPFQLALKRPDIYVGCIVSTKTEMPIFNENGEIVTDIVAFNEGLNNITREIGSNCIDNNWRSKEAKISMTSIKITFDSTTGEISFYNDGFFISAEKDDFEYEDHRTGKITSENMYPAELYFGDMMVSTNYDDDKVRKTSGKNGLGGKICVIFSKTFTVEHTDPTAGKKFTMTFSNNAKERTKPKLSAFSGKTGWTKITFIPDYERFGYPVSEPEIQTQFVGMLRLYAAEIAAVSGVPTTFTLDDKPSNKFNINTFDKYTRLFYPEVKTHKMGLIKLPNGDECVVVESHPFSEEDELGDCQHFAYVNGIRTKSGGIHVDGWRDTIISSFVRAFNSRSTPKNKTALKTTAKKTYPYLTFFIRTEMDKPAFEANTKHRLNGRHANKVDNTKEAIIADYKVIPPGKAGTSVKEEIEELVTKMLKWNFVTTLENKLSGKKDKITQQKIRNHKKIRDCANARHGKPHLCILWISEGLSPHALIVNGISSIEDTAMDSNGMYAIQGKFLNVKVATKEQIEKNQEIQDLQALLGLSKGLSDTKTDFSKDENFKRIRYHTVRLAADMDEDGIHIRGLLINFFFHLYPTLLDREGFLDSFSTAAVKVTLNGKKDPLLFYSNMEYKKWYDEYTSGPTLEVAIKEAKYLKGLAAINDDDAPMYFTNLKTVKYYKEGDEAEYMDLAFGKCVNNKEKNEMKKNWIIRDMKKAKPVLATVEGFDTEDVTSGSDKEVISSADDDSDDEFVYEGDYGISTFVDRQLVIYNRMSLHRALPNNFDGLKESQQKILYAMLKIKGTKTLDLQKIVGRIKEISQYHHGGESMSGAIAGMATRYPGDNNIPYLKNDGQYATRLLGPSEFGADRYLHTHIEPIMKVIFKEIDNNILTQIVSDNVKVEYKHFVPVINMLAVNGSKGIATGFSTDIPAHNPVDILDFQEAWLKCVHKDLPKIKPWYRGIKGPITLSDDNKRWFSEGILTECVGKGCPLTIGKKKTKCKGLKGWWHITDLPVGVWSEDFEVTIKEMMEDSKTPKGIKIPKRILDYNNYCTTNLVHFMIKPVKDWEPNMDMPDMKNSHSLMNMYTIDENHYPKKYETVEDLLQDWMPKRLHFYNLRKEYLIKLSEHDKEIASNRYIFVKAVADKKLDMNKPKAQVKKDMIKMGLKEMKLKITGGDDDEDDEKDEVDSKKSKKNEPSFKYLTSIQMGNMTKEKQEKLKKEVDIHQQKIDAISKKSGVDLWLEDMAEFRTAWMKFVKDNPHV